MNRKFLVTLLFLILAGWIAGCAYWYVYKIRKSGTTELVDNSGGTSSSDSLLNSEIEITEIEKPTFLISDGNIVIAESSSNISFENGTANIVIPDSMRSSLKLLAEYLEANPDKNINITGLYSTIDNSDSLGIARAKYMGSYFNNEFKISQERIITNAKSTNNLYKNEETNTIIGGLVYQIASNTEYESIKGVETNVKQNSTGNAIDKNLQRKVKRRQIMYYPLTHFEVEPTYKHERYFKNLKKYFDSNPEGLVQITGHTSAEDDASLSAYHSRQYAKKVKKYLISEYDMNPRNFRTKGRGDTRPVASSDTDLGKAENRRIEFTLIK